jgi:CubicO group peptidase (beta-lactamase class C family)
MRNSAAVLALIVFAVSCSPCAARTASVPFPKTDAGKRAAGYFKAFNSAKEGDLGAFLEANMVPEALAQRPVEDRVNALHRIKEDVGTLEAAKIVLARDDAITLIAKSSKEQWLEIALAFEKRAPHRLLGARFQILDEPPDLNAPTVPLTETEIIRQTEDYLDGLVAKDDFSGVVLVAKGDTPVFRKAYGLASREYDVPNRVDTRFNLGSINKFITRIAIEQLAGTGVLSLDDKIATFLPNYPNREAAKAVTIRNLLDMTSGIGDFFGANYTSMPKDELRNLADYLPLFADEPLHFEPGTSSEYSNGGYIVLGLIIEKASAQSYFDYVREHVYQPALMRDTDHLMADVPVENVASGYTRDWDGNEHPDEPRRNNIYTRPARGSSAGGGYSTADDLLKLLIALEAGTLAAPGAAAEAARGMAIAGGAPGINAYVETHPRVGYTVIVLSNYDPPSAMKPGQKIGSLLERLQ